AINTHKMHREEYEINSHECYPKMEIPQFFIHHPAKHLWIPMVDPGQHPKNRCRSHNQVEVGYHEIGIMYENIYRRITDIQPRQAARVEMTNQREDTCDGGRNSKLTPPQRCQVGD